MLQGLSEITTGLTPFEIQRELRENSDADLRRRRAIIGLSLIGVGIAAAASLLQTGIVKHLPDPPVGNFDADKVITSDEAYQFGIPDATIALTGFAANIPLAAWGRSDRAKIQPILPIAATAKAAMEAALAGWYFYQMPTKEKAWCGYCILAATVYFSIFALTLPEAGKAMSALGAKQ
jgi:uncharacterized membrane protein